MTLRFAAPYSKEVVIRARPIGSLALAAMFLAACGRQPRLYPAPGVQPAPEENGDQYGFTRR